MTGARFCRGVSRAGVSGAYTAPPPAGSPLREGAIVFKGESGHQCPAYPQRIHANHRPKHPAQSQGASHPNAPRRQSRRSSTRLGKRTNARRRPCTHPNPGAQPPKRAPAAKPPQQHPAGYTHPTRDEGQAPGPNPGAQPPKRAPAAEPPQQHPAGYTHPRETKAKHPVQTPAAQPPKRAPAAEPPQQHPAGQTHPTQN